MFKVQALLLAGGYVGDMSVGRCCAPSHIDYVLNSTHVTQLGCSSSLSILLAGAMVTLIWFTPVGWLWTDVFFWYPDPPADDGKGKGKDRGQHLETGTGTDKGNGKDNEPDNGKGKDKDTGSSGADGHEWSSGRRVRSRLM